MVWQFPQFIAVEIHGWDLETIAKILRSTEEMPKCVIFGERKERCTDITNLSVSGGKVTAIIAVQAVRI